MFGYVGEYGYLCVSNSLYLILICKLISKSPCEGRLAFCQSIFLEKAMENVKSMPLALLFYTILLDVVRKSAIFATFLMPLVSFSWC